MKKLLLSVVALMVATLLFSQDDTSDLKKDVSQDVKVEKSSKANMAS